MKHSFPELQLHATFTADNWQKELTDLSLDAALHTAREIGQENCIHLAVALLQHYYMHGYAQSLPFIDSQEKHRHFLEALNLVLQDVGLELDICTACKEIRKP